MSLNQPDHEPITFSGSMKAGFYTAQLGVSLIVAVDSIELRSFGRSFVIERPNHIGLVDTSLLGIFKRGIRFIHQQPGVPNPLVFYPSVSQEHLRAMLAERGWT